MEYFEKENNGFNDILNYVDDHFENIYFIVDDERNSDVIKFKEIAHVSNCDDKTNLGYEECNALFFESLNGEQGVLTYHNLPLILKNGDYEVFNKEKYFLKKYNLDDLKTVKLVFGFNGPIFKTDIETGDYHTGIDAIDNDILLRKLNREASLIFKKIHDLKIDQIFTEDKDTKNIRTNEKLKLDAIGEKMHNRIVELNKDNKFYFIDTFKFSYKKEAEKQESNDKFYLTDNDWKNLSNNDDVYFNNVGAEYYKKGDYKHAFPYYLISAIMGDDQAISNLGYCFMYERGVEKNDDLAIALFKLSADLGNQYSCYKMATIYSYNENKKDLMKAREYYIKAFINGRDNFGYEYNPSLCLNVAREKIKGRIFEKDLFGAYLLLKIAYRGYKREMNDKVPVFKEQFIKTKELLEDSIFDEVKKDYYENDEDCYVFNTLPIYPKEFHKDLIKIGDEVVNLVTKELSEDDDDELPVGMIGRVCEIHTDGYLVEISNSDYDPKYLNVYSFKTNEVKKYHSSFN